MDTRLDRLHTLIGEVVDLVTQPPSSNGMSASTCPQGGATTRTDTVATVRRIAHEKFTAPEIGDLLATLKTDADRQDPASEAARLVAVTARDYEKATCVPADFVAEHAQVTSTAQHAWQQARYNRRILWSLRRIWRRSSD